MKFSIVTACWNSAATIGKTIESVKSQRDADFEHIIVDGLSRDATADIVREHAPGATFISEKDEGLYDAMNKGIRHASGDVVVMLNSDDHYAHPHVLRDVARRFYETGAEGVFADVAFYDPRDTQRIVRHYRSDRFTPARIRNGVMPAHPGMFLRRTVYDRFGLYAHRGYPVSADFEFVARMFAGEGIDYAFHPDIVVMMLPGGASNSGWQSKKRIFDECLRACRDNGIAASTATMLGKYPIKALDYLDPRKARKAAP